jgi:hypothetical protein
MAELAVLLRVPPAEIRAMDSRDLVTVLAVVSEASRRGR